MVHTMEPYIKLSFTTAVYAAFNVSHDLGLGSVEDYIR
jgi:hypothetical protein